MSEGRSVEGSCGGRITRCIKRYQKSDRDPFKVKIWLNAGIEALLLVDRGSAVWACSLESPCPLPFPSSPSLRETRAQVGKHHDGGA